MILLQILIIYFEVVFILTNLMINYIIKMEINITQQI